MSATVLYYTAGTTKYDLHEALSTGREATCQYIMYVEKLFRPTSQAAKTHARHPTCNVPAPCTDVEMATNGLLQRLSIRCRPLLLTFSHPSFRRRIRR